MKQLLKTLYVTTQECRLSLNNNAVVVEKIHTGEKHRFTANTIDSIMCFGNTTVTTPLMQFCCDNGIGLSFYSEYGNFYARVNGAATGNVLLRQAQFHILDSEHKLRLQFARSILDAKLRNSRAVLKRAARDNGSLDFDEDIELIGNCIARMRSEDNLDSLRGLEGIAARTYFSAFARLIKTTDPGMQFMGREQHPPVGRVNSLLSYVYTLLANDTESALESVGLDTQCGFMHSLTPGKPALALDMMEELRAQLCDRFVLSLINKNQITSFSFTQADDGMFLLNEDARKTILTFWRARKEENILHPAINETIPIGMIPFAQAQLLARFVRGDEPEYKAFIWR